MNKKEKYNYLLEEIIATAKLEQGKTFTYKFYEEANEILSQTQLEKMCGTLAKKFPDIFEMISNASPSMYIWEICDVGCRIKKDIRQLEKIKREIVGLLVEQDENIKRDKILILEADITTDYALWVKGNREQVYNMKKKTDGKFLPSGKRMFGLISNLGTVRIKREEKNNIVTGFIKNLGINKSEAESIFFNKNGKWGIKKEHIEVIPR